MKGPRCSLCHARGFGAVARPALAMYADPCLWQGRSLPRAQIRVRGKGGAATRANPCMWHGLLSATRANPCPWQGRGCHARESGAVAVK